MHLKSLFRDMFACQGTKSRNFTAYASVTRTQYGSIDHVTWFFRDRSRRNSLIQEHYVHVVPGDRSTATSITPPPFDGALAYSFNRHLRGLRDSCVGCFRVLKKITWPNRDANSWEDVLSVDTNSLRPLPRRSSKNCNMQFANSDIFKEN